jgi:hypothetical protein
MTAGKTIRPLGDAKLTSYLCRLAVVVACEKLLVGERQCLDRQQFGSCGKSLGSNLRCVSRQ